MTTLTVRATLESLPAVAQFVCRAGRSAGLDAYRLYQLRLAVDEIATNIITHGYDDLVSPGKLNLEARQEAHCLKIILEDHGRRFDPRELPAPDVHLPPDQRPEGGLGVYLARWSVDQVLFEGLSVGNRTTFVINLEAS